MTEHPKVSIVIPIYNVEEYLDECIKSAVKQTLRDIEIILVDDASTDGSLQIAQEYADADSRIKLISYKQNKSAFQARKDGVMQAFGQYVMFLDGDDYLELNACEELYEIISLEKVDMVHFGTSLINLGSTSENNIKNVRKLLLPFDGKLYDKDVFKGCFVEKKYRFSIWNKIYSAELCKKAFEHLDDGCYPKAQDLYAFYALCFFAVSYCGVPDKVYYNYRFGAGITGKNTITINEFERFCTQAKVADAIAAFNSKHGTSEDHDTVNSIRIDLINECVRNWYQCLKEEHSAQGFDLLAKSWHADELAASLYSRYYNERKSIAKKINSCKKEIAELQREQHALTEQLKLERKKNSRIVHSSSYRLGKLLTSPIRWLKKKP